MKSRFSTFDIKAIVGELQQKLVSLRVVNVYDINSKTYLIKLAKTDEKAVLLLESGIRLHTTEFEWPKNVMPSGFAMKMRKHLKGRRLEKIEQLGVDRIVDMQFGSSEAAYHVILELYDRGNIILTDYDYMILSIQRPRTDDSQDVRFAVRERYPIDLAKQDDGPVTMEKLMSVLTSSKNGDNLKKILNPHLALGGSLIEHCMILLGLNINAKLGHDFRIAEDSSRLLDALNKAEEIMKNLSLQPAQGYIIQQKEKAAAPTNSENEVLLMYSEYHPILFRQHQNFPYLSFSSFDQAVDEFFSQIESQKQDRKLLQQEKTALKKLDGIKNEHVKRLDALKSEQEIDIHKARLIELNLTMVDRAITVIRSALANQIDWPEIQEMIDEAAQQRDPVAVSIKSLKLDTNHFTMLLKVPDDSDEGSDEEELRSSVPTSKQLKVDIDLGLSAYANARKYYDLKRHAAVKEQKTVDSTEKAMKSAERKAKQTLKEVRMVATINKARKTFWFEKFLWFISSENYIVIGGRDQQQNELIVKRYLKPGDLYVHADLHGASSVVIKNPSKGPVPPKTLNEAGAMALCYSAAWDARVVTSSWWVHHDQVSKTAPSGEYLTTGSFMIRGKKNFLPPSHLIYGFGFLYKVDESCVFRHKNERRVRTVEEEDAASVAESSVDLELKEESLEDDSPDDEDEPKKSGEQANGGDDLLEQEDIEHAPDETSEKEKSLLDDVENADNYDDFVDVKDEDKLKSSAADNEIQTVADEEQCEFPDTSIQLHHVKGGEFTLRRENSLQSQQQNESKVIPDSENVVTSSAGEPELIPKVARLSAKQRRELKKKKRSELSEDVNEEPENEPVEEAHVNAEADERLAANPSHPPQQPVKRGQRGKLKKIKEKYGDQDEEERQLRMELLASSRGPKEEKPKKGKKGKQPLQQNKKEQHSGGGPKTQETKQKQRPIGRLSLQDIKEEQATIQESDTVTVGKTTEPLKSGDIEKSGDVEEADDGNDGEGEEDGGQILQDVELLSSLTGIPDSEDLLLFCLSVCAPYTAIVNYKYKVKLMPGTTKRGKAAKLAVNMFLHDKAASIREKDLLKSLKDTDLSRNMPGKVKVSAPNLFKQKRK